MIVAIECYIIYCKNPQLAKDFYSQRLGFEEVSANHKFVLLELAGVRIGLNLADKPEKHPGHQTIILRSNEVERDFMAMKALGVSIRDTLTDKGFGKTFTISDPEGNKIEIIQG